MTVGPSFSSGVNQNRPDYKDPRGEQLGPGRAIELFEALAGALSLTMVPNIYFELVKPEGVWNEAKRVSRRDRGCRQRRPPVRRQSARRAPF